MEDSNNRTDIFIYDIPLWYIISRDGKGGVGEKRPRL